MNLYLKCVFWVLAFFSCFLFTASAKNIAPNTYNFEDNDTIPIILSSLNLNRLVVKNDKITALDCPVSFCTSKANKNDTSGSITLRLNISLPFTAQISTKNGRNFTLFITPRAIPSVVSEFIGFSNTRNEEKIFQRNSSYPSALTSFTKKMMLWTKYKTNIDGFSLHIIDPKTIPKEIAYSELSVVPQTVFAGESYSGIIYKVTNRKSTPVKLSNAQFYGKRSRSASIANVDLDAGQSTFLYIITGGGANVF